MRATLLFFASFFCAGISFAQTAPQTQYLEELNAWRAKAETSLKRDTGWLTLAGRWELKQGVNRIGAAADNDIVFPAGVAQIILAK